MSSQPSQQPGDYNRPSSDRREFLKTAGLLAAGTGVLVGAGEAARASAVAATSEASLVLPSQWQSLNPGFWQVDGGVLRRRLSNVGDRARATGFPFHSATRGQQMKTEYDPSLPPGIIYRNDWNLQGGYTVEATFVYRAAAPSCPEGDDPAWKMYTAGYGWMGLAFGSKSVFESYGKIRNTLQVVWSDNDELALIAPKNRSRTRTVTGEQLKVKAGLNLQPGDQVRLKVGVSPIARNVSRMTAELQANGITKTLVAEGPSSMFRGYAGVTARGLVDFEVSEFAVDAPAHNRRNAPEFDCFSCYPLGDTLQQTDGQWTCRFVSLFASDGQTAELRIADSPTPQGGWASVPVAGTAKIVNHEWRRNTAVITATLPVSPASTTLYYTIWKDGVDVTADTRIGTDQCGPGSGFVGDVPSSGTYVGRLPQLTAPYKLCGLSCHAITSGLQQPQEDGSWRILGGSDDWQFRDQPSMGSYQHLEDYDFQVMVWEDDVWYMELVLYPPSTDDAYRVVTSSICGPTSRWQMMRHWNIINPGDHDYGMDDVKGPEQIAIRRVDGLGQDASYMRRNFQIVHHLITGDEQVDPLANPKKWRAWKMPNRDFTLVILDSRLWRSSQDTDIWTASGWGAFKSLYDRTDPTRSLLGEEQFAWLQNLVQTDSSRLICLTGINGMHTVWAGTKNRASVGDHIAGAFDQRDRVTADYAGWVKAGADRVLELLGSRDGIVSVYGDVHNGCVMTNQQHRVIECSFGPIGRSGGRAVIPGFGPQMKDFDGRDVAIHALYHKEYAGPNLQPHEDGQPFYWNFLEMAFDPRPADPAIAMTVRNLVDGPSEAARGGGALQTTASQTGRPVDSRVPALKTLPDADVHFSTVDGEPIRGTRSLGDGSVPLSGLIDVPSGSRVLMVAFDGQQTDAQVVTTT
ncbi:MAG: alkaline phosphatase D family protein [Planctomycetaceae bacterium]|nr:alkaline phosphatase D family protein [Planctomycetaceae bacterium]